jgi:prostaglandin-endoperoxide synthase 2
MTQRNKSADSIKSRFQFYFLTHFRLFWKIVNHFQPLKLWFNALLINKVIASTKPRPNPLSLWGSYTSWKSLTDRSFSSRHLPPAPEEYIGSLPSLDETATLFEREGEARLSNKSTVLFAHFAQWFTDGFLRTNKPPDWQHNTSNHEIDLSELYGPNELATNELRAKNGGFLKSQFIDGEEYPPYYFGPDGLPQPEFKEIKMIAEPWVHPESKPFIFAMGGERANIQIGFAALNVLFLREHNRICKLLQTANPTWDDERYFQTARCIITIIVIKIVVEEYIPHISPFQFCFVANPVKFRNVNWYRTNWMAVEFALLYRWHGLVPTTYIMGEETWHAADFLFNNKLLIDKGLGAWIDASSRQKAGDIGPFNTPDFIMEAEKASIQLGRDASLTTYNDYRKCFCFAPVTSFDQISGDPKVQKKLEDLYGTVDRIELYAGLFAEDREPGGILAQLMGTMVSVDAFSQALTNPLLSENVFNENTFTSEGMVIFNQTKNLQDVVDRNTNSEKPGKYLSTFTQVGYKS